jgi:hypothetical protein
MKIYKLTSEYSIIAKYISCIIAFTFLLFLIYAVITKNIPASIFMIVGLSYFYLFLLRNFWRYKLVNFDNEFIYSENLKLPYSEVLEIKKGKIIYGNLDRKNVLYFNYKFSSNFSILKEFYNLKKIRK